MPLNITIPNPSKNYYDSFDGKYAGFVHYGSYAQRVTPFFDTVKECEAYEIENDINEDSYIRPVANWQESIVNRNEYNTADYLSENE